MRKKVTALLMILCMLAVLLPWQSMPVMADTTSDGKYEYTVNGDSVTITKYNQGSETTANIPGTIEGKTVTSIGGTAFYLCGGLTEVTLPEKLTSIGERAFEGCDGLTSFSIPESVTSIGERAFSHCSGLTSIMIPESVTSIGEGVFEACSGLTSVNIPESVTSIGKQAFIDCRKLVSITIPENVTNIGERAFEGCVGLTEINIPEKVTSISVRAFQCSGLTSISIPESVTSIGSEAFRDCTSLESITIPESVTEIGEYTFYSCIGLKSITILGSATSIGDHAFDYCDQLKMVLYTGTEEEWDNIGSKFPLGISKRYPVIPPEIQSKSYNGSPQKADVTDNEYYTVSKNDGGTDPGSYDVELTLKDTGTYAWTTAVTSAAITLNFEITPATGGGGAIGGGGSTSGGSTGGGCSYTPVTPPVNPQPEQKQPVTGTRTVLAKDENGNEVPVELTTTTHPDGTVTDAKAKLTRNGSRKKNQLTGLLSGALIASIVKEAKTEDVELTITVQSGKKTYELKADSQDLIVVAKLKVLAVDPKTGELTLVSGKTYRVDSAGNVKMTLPAGKNYQFMTVKEAKAIEKNIAKSIQLKKKIVTLKKGKKYQIRLDSSFNAENIKSITYSSNDTSVATVSKSGKVTAKGKGKVKIKVKVTLKNGITKTLTIQLNVE